MQACRAATDVSLFDPPAPAASAQAWSVSAVRLSPVPACLSPTTPPTHAAATHGGPVRSRNMDGRATRYAAALAGVRLHTKKGVRTVPRCN